MADYNDAIRINPQYASAYRERAVLKRTTGDTGGADADLAKAKQLDANIR